MKGGIYVRKPLNFILLCLFILLCSSKKVIALDEYDVTMKQDILVLFLAYPEYIKGVEKDSNNNVYLILNSGKRVLYDDKTQKNHEAKLNNPDIQDMLEQIYPLESLEKLPETNYDPGRGRIYSLLYEVYGSNKGLIEKNLKSTSGGQFNKANGAATALNSVMKDVNEASKTNPKIGGFVYPINGTYNFRYISGTGRLSPHAFGIAIDIKSHPNDYWKWNTRENGEKRMLSYPKELVEIFEKHNFIWGGKWGHFDILHFEYRPEIIIKAKYFGKKVDKVQPWYLGVPDQDKIRDYINVIDNSLK